MIIEVEGTRFNNCGSELMLRSIVHEVGGWAPQVRVAVYPRDSYDERASAGVWQKLDLARLGLLQGPVRRRIPASVRQRFGVVIPEEVDAILDASGFRYSDQWGGGPTRNLVPRVRAARRAQQPYIFLPQAFGPFETANTRAAFAEAMRDATLVFARDEDSLAHIHSVIGDDPRVAVAPDFTAALPAGTPAGTALRGDRPLAAVVANYRMIDKTDEDTGARYRQFVRAAIGELERGGFQPVLVVHSTEREDREFVQALAESEAGVPIFEEPDVLRLKRFIGDCEILVGSRFHALVNGLAQGVPCVGTGWSHKYHRLFEQYGCTEYLVDLHRPAEDEMGKLRRMLEPGERERIRAQLDIANARILGEIRAMWDRVRGALVATS